MPACCSRPEKHGDLHCPVCGRKGKPVPALTIKANVDRDHPRYWDLDDGVMCLNPDDDTVYFFLDKDVIIKHEDIITGLGFKSDSSSDRICYCYQYGRKEILDEVRGKGKSEIEAKIRARVKAGQCTCEVSNPKGSCCLGDIRSLIREPTHVG